VSDLAAFRRGWVTFSQDFRGKESSLGNVFGLLKTRHILLTDSTNCTVLRAVVLTQYRRVTDRRKTDGIAIVSTALAMRALRRAAKKHVKQQYVLHMSSQYGELRPING